MVLGSSRFIPGFEDALIGARAGEERNIQVTFPDDYQAQALAGKEAGFHIKVKEVAKPRRSAVRTTISRSRSGWNRSRNLRMPSAASCSANSTRQRKAQA